MTNIQPLTMMSSDQNTDRVMLVIHLGWLMQGHSPFDCLTSADWLNGRDGSHCLTSADWLTDEMGGVGGLSNQCHMSSGEGRLWVRSRSLQCRG